MRSRESIRVLCTVFYLLCLMNLLGLPLDGQPDVRRDAAADTTETWAQTQTTVETETDHGGEQKRGGGQGVGDEGEGGERGEGEGGEEQGPRIALTFDDGPSIYTEQLLDGLKERQVKATFFLIGQYVEEHPQVVKRIHEEGHLIGNHTYHHVKLTGLSDAQAEEEILKTDQAVYEITGEHVGYLRPPFGEWKQDLELEYEVLPVMWTIDPLDWTTENVDEIVNKVVTQAGENDMILLHDCYETSVEAALRIVDILKEQGFQFVTADALILE